MKMSHKSARVLLNMAQDGDLSSTAQILLETHLMGCDECQAYADELAQLEAKLAQKLPAIWAALPVSPAKLAHTMAVVNADRRRCQRWQPIWQRARMAFKLSLAAISFVWLFFYFRPLSKPAEETTETAVPAANSQEIDAPIPSISAHFDFVVSDGVGSAQFCDDAAYTPQTDALWQKGQPLPECELAAGNTLLFQPGETRAALLIFRNDQPEAIQFSFVPAADLGDGQPFADALCGNGVPFPSGRPNCRQYQVSGNGVWAKNFTITAPETLAPGTNLNISVHIKSSD